MLLPSDPFGQEAITPDTLREAAAELLGEANLNRQMAKSTAKLYRQRAADAEERAAKLQSLAANLEKAIAKDSE